MGNSVQLKWVNALQIQNWDLVASIITCLWCILVSLSLGTKDWSVISVFKSVCCFNLRTQIASYFIKLIEFYSNKLDICASI